MDSEAEADTDRTIDLQSVLHRYVDSEQGYAHASDLVEVPGLASAFSEISASRSAGALKIAAMLHREGEEPDVSGTLEGAGHRWWMTLRKTVTEEDLHAVLCECIRGEKVLAGTLRAAIDAGNLNPVQEEALREALADVEKAIGHFETAVNGRQRG